MSFIPELKRGFVLAVSAPSGTGKTSLCDRLADEHPNVVVRSISLTTRPKREGEKSLKDYEFVSLEEFKAREAAGELLETAEVFGNFYGTPKGPVDKALAETKIIVMDIDVVGALRIKKILGNDCVSLFVFPPSLEELRRRLIARGKNTPEELTRRLNEAEREMAQAHLYDYAFCNKDLEEAYDQLLGIVKAETARTHRLDICSLKRS
jgi:guanylate kinase